MLQIFLLKSKKMLKLNFPQPKDLALIPIFTVYRKFFSRLLVPESGRFSYGTVLLTVE